MAKASPTYKNKKKSQPVKKDEALTKVLDDFKASWDYTSGSWHQRWESNYLLYNNQRTKRGYEGITDTFVPMTFGTIETLTSALFGAKPKFNYLPPKEKPDQKTDILNSLLDFFWDKDQWSIKVINTGRAMLQLGTAVDYFFWDRDHPVMINVPIRDFFIDPTATSLENARYMGRRFLSTIDELKTFEIVDPETGDMLPKYKNLDKIKEENLTGAPGGAGETTDKQEKDMWYGSTVNEPEKHQVEVLEYWTGDKTISVVNRSVVIEDTENYYKAKARANGVKHPRGLMPFAVARDYVDMSLFYAKSEIDFIADQQELLNDITNQNTDAITYALNPMYTLDPKYADKISEVENLPGAVYPFESGTLAPIQMANVPQDAFNERLNIKNEMRETSGSSEIVRGVKSDQDPTATEVNAQIAGAGQRIGLKITQIENEYFHRMARIVFELIKLYVTEPRMVQILGKDGAKWEEFDPSDFLEGEYEPRAQLDIIIENQKQEDSANAKEMLAAFLGDPDINQQELKKLALAKSFRLDPDEVQLLMQPQGEMQNGMGEEEMLPPEAMVGPPMPQLPPEGPPEQMMDVVIDPITGELMPAAMEPLPSEVMV